MLSAPDMNISPLNLTNIQSQMNKKIKKAHRRPELFLASCNNKFGLLDTSIQF